MKARRVPQMMAVWDGRLAEIMRDEMKPNYLANRPRHSDVLSLCMDMALELGPHVVLNQSRALIDRPDQSKTQRGAYLPALVLCGRDDTLCPTDRHELMADLIPGVHLEVVESAEHLPTLKQPETTTAALMFWLET